MDALKVEIITRDFNRMLREFAELEPRLEFGDIVRGIAGRVAAASLRRTRSADPNRIKRDYESREWTTLDGRKIKLSWHLHDDALHQRVVNHREDVLATKLGSRGLAKKSWLWFALPLGTKIDAPSYVHTANYSGRNHPENATTTETGTAATFVLTINNTSPIVQGAGGERALYQSMAGETRYFFTLLSKQAFRTAQARAARYPGVYVQPSAKALLP